MGFYFFIGIFSCLAFTSNYAQNLTEGLVLALSFEDGKGNTAVDSSPSAKHAKVDGKVAWVDGKHGEGINFNEKDFTVQFWFNCKLHKGVVFSQYEKNAKNLS